MAVTNCPALYQLLFISKLYTALKTGLTSYIIPSNKNNFLLSLLFLGRNCRFYIPLVTMRPVPTSMATQLLCLDAKCPSNPSGWVVNGTFTTGEDEHVVHEGAK